MARAIWKGTLGFGLVNVSVELLTASAPESLDLDLLDRRDHARIGYRKYNKTTGDEVTQDDIVRGYAVSSGTYVVLDDADLKAANPAATQSIDIVGFVPQSAVPRIFYDKPYYVSPMKGSDRAYALLRDALASTEQLAVAQLVIHTRQHMAAVYAQDEALVVQLLRYAADLKTSKVAGVREVAALPRTAASRELAMAKQLIATMAMDWEPATYRDTYRDDILRLVEQRANAGGSREVLDAGDTGPKQTKVLDLVAALQKSLGGAAARKPAASSRKTTGSNTASRAGTAKRAPVKSGAKKTAGRTSRRGAA